jgi:regulator of replication initiation timing
MHNLLLTLDGLDLDSLKKTNIEEENILLSIENTKLRQRIGKLTAIVESYSYR